VGKSDLGVRLLTCEDEQEAKGLAAELDKHNAERKAIESLVQEEAMQYAEMQADEPLILVQGKGWHPGVIGIVAGRIKERFNRPVAVVAIADGLGKASARSVSGFDMGSAVIAACDAGLLVAGGGHAMAAGFTVEEHKMAELRAFLLARAMIKHAELTHHKRLHLDAELTLAGATEDLVEKIERLGPFGQGNPSVRVAVRGAVNMKPEIVGQSHVRTFLKDPLGKGSLSAIAFRAVDSKLGEALFATRGRVVDIACQMKINEWMGRRSVNLVIEDIASAREAL
jgi:single-stranded-DNA-specific exonuclease